MDESQTGRRLIPIHQQVIGPAPGRPKKVTPRQRGDYPAVPRVYLDVAKRLSSPLLMGPPLCDELIALVRHMLTEEEASVARHLRLFPGRTADDVARTEHLPLEQAVAILNRLADQKRVIAASGPDQQRRYHWMPIVPGIFEMVLIDQTPETITPWHRRFAELFEALFETGYSLEYWEHRRWRPAPAVRYLPVGRAIEAHPMALPSDRLEVVLDRFKVFAVGQCQCRTTSRVVGRGCDAPLGNCTVMGEWAERGIQQGFLKQVTKSEVLAIKAEAESHGLVTWMMNVESSKGQCSCSCCGCCCHALRMASEFNVPGLFAPPHFLPRLDPDRCSYCGKCARRCPMGAIVVDCQGKTQRHLIERCIGCGLCALACDRQRAIAMEPVPDYKLPYRSWFALLLRSAPQYLKTSWDVWRSR